MRTRIGLRVRRRGEVSARGEGGAARAAKAVRLRSKKRGERLQRDW